MKRMRSLAIITCGVFLMSIGIVFFFGPADLVTGGLTGIAVLLHYLFPVLSMGVLLLIGNIVFFAMGFRFLGKRFGVYTLYASFMYAAFTWLLELLFPIRHPLSEILLVNLFYGCALMGFGMYLVFSQGASTGGTDIPSQMLHKYTNLDLGKSLMVIDFAIVVPSALLISLDKAMVGALGVALSNALVDFAISGDKRRIIMTIVSDRTDEINRFIMEEINRGSTIYEAMGGYTKRRQRIIVTIVQRGEYFAIRAFVHRIDPTAFVYISHVSEVFGEGFTFEEPDLNSIKSAGRSASDETGKDTGLAD